MINVLLVYTKDGLNHTFIKALKGLSGTDIKTAASGEEALKSVKNNQTDLIISAETLPDMSGLTLLETLVKVNPFVNSALVSRLSESDFHEATEGLGILMSVPPDADEAFAESLLNYLNKIIVTAP